MKTSIIKYFLIFTLIITGAMAQDVPGFLQMPGMDKFKTESDRLSSLYAINIIQLSPEQAKTIIAALEPLLTMQKKILNSFNSYKDFDKIMAGSMKNLYKSQLPPASNIKKFLAFARELEKGVISQYDSAYEKCLASLMSTLSDDQKNLCVMLSIDLMEILQIPIYDLEKALKMSNTEFNSKKLRIAENLVDYASGLDERIDKGQMRRTIITTLERVRSRNLGDKAIFLLMNNLMSGMTTEDFDEEAIQASLVNHFISNDSYEAIKRIYSL